MVTVLADPALYAFTGGEPPTLAMLDSRYASQVAGSGLPGEDWYNWIVRLEGASIGFVQATTTEAGAELAWVIGVPWQGHGYATEAAMAMRDWLVSIGVDRFSAHIHPHHAASAAVAQRLKLWPTGVLDEDGESIWASAAIPPNLRTGLLRGGVDH
jgi:RimJ/RimL family protein N-acetyltransferase